MKNEPTALELFQAERIKALEARVRELEDQQDAFKAKNVRVIDINDPKFDKPISEVFPISAVGEI